MNKKGMTLIELMAVIALLAILSMIAVPSFNAIRTKMLKSSLESKISNIKNAALEYYTENINEVAKTVRINNENYLNYFDIDYIYNPSAFCLDDSTTCDGDYRCTPKKTKEGKYFCEEDCGDAFIKVGTLIEENYLVGDNDKKTNLINPVNKSSLNEVLVCVKYDSNKIKTRKLEAFIINEESLYGE